LNGEFSFNRLENHGKCRTGLVPVVVAGNFPLGNNVLQKLKRVKEKKSNVKQI